MNFSIKREDILNALNDSLSIIKENQMKPSLSGIFISNNDDLVTIMALNSEMSFIKTVPCKSKENGEFLIKPQLLMEYLKSLDSKDIEIEKSDNFIKIENAFFSTLDKENFPKITQVTPISIMNINGGHLEKIFEKTKFAASQSTDNLALNCLKMVFDKTKIEVISTDSYRLLYFTENIPTFIEKDISIPLESINVISKLIKNLESEVEIGYSGEDLIINWENSYFICKLISVPFPNYKNILGNENFTKTMEFIVSELKSALKVVMSISKTNNEAKYGGTFKFVGKNLTISSVSSKAKVNQKINMIKTGEDLVTSLNSKYLYEFVEKLEKNVIMKGDLSSSMLKVTEHENNNYTYIIMPLALR